MMQSNACSWNQFGVRPAKIPSKPLSSSSPQFHIPCPVPQPDRVRLPRQWIDPEDKFLTGTARHWPKIQVLDERIVAAKAYLGKGT